MESAYFPRAQEHQIPWARAITNVSQQQEHLCCKWNSTSNNFITETHINHKDNDNEKPVWTFNCYMILPGPFLAANCKCPPAHFCCDDFSKVLQSLHSRAHYSLNLRVPCKISPQRYLPKWDPALKGCAPTPICITQPIAVDPPSGGAPSLLHPNGGHLLKTYGSLYL